MGDGEERRGEEVREEGRIVGRQMVRVGKGREEKWVGEGKRKGRGVNRRGREG